MAEKESFEMHSDLLKSVIFQQAGSVEKAILEAIQNSLDAGSSEISICLNENGFIIIDDGEGMNADTLSSLLEHARDNDMGIGLYNVDRRIKLLFGVDYGLSIESELLKGTKVTITIPSEDAFEEGDDLYENKH